MPPRVSEANQVHAFIGDEFWGARARDTCTNSQGTIPASLPYATCSESIRHLVSRHFTPL